MNRHLRDTLRAIREAGGKPVDILYGGRHTHVYFISAGGKPQRIVLHKGNKVSFRAERRLRSQLRNGDNR